MSGLASDVQQKAYNDEDPIREKLGEIANLISRADSHMYDGKTSKAIENIRKAKQLAEEAQKLCEKHRDEHGEKDD